MSMKSLRDLNNYAATGVEYIDDRTAGVVFDRDPFNDTTLEIYQSQSATIEPGVEILEIINYATAALAIRIEVSNFDSAITFAYPNKPAYITADDTVDSSGNIIEFSGFRTVSDWNWLKNNFTISTDGTFVGEMVYSVNFETSTQSEFYTTTVTFVDYIALTDPGFTYYNDTGDSTVNKIINYPSMALSGTDTFDLTITVSDTSLIEDITGPNGSYDSGLGEYTYSGNSTEIDNELANLYLIPVFGARDDFTLTYELTTPGGTDTVVQTVYNAEFLGAIGANLNYTAGAAFTLNAAPPITNTEYDTTDDWHTYTIQATSGAAYVSNLVGGTYSQYHLEQSIDVTVDGSNQAYIITKEPDSVICSDGITMFISYLGNTRYLYTWTRQPDGNWSTPSISSGIISNDTYIKTRLDAGVGWQVYDWVLSGDGSKLYVSLNESSGSNRDGKVNVYDVASDGTLSNETTIYSHTATSTSSAPSFLSKPSTDGTTVAFYDPNAVSNEYWIYQNNSLLFTHTNPGGASNKQLTSAQFNSDGSKAIINWLTNTTYSEYVTIGASLGNIQTFTRSTSSISPDFTKSYQVDTTNLYFYELISGSWTLQNSTTKTDLITLPSEPTRLNFGRFFDNNTIYAQYTYGAGDNDHVETWFLIDVSDIENPVLSYATPFNEDDSVYTEVIDASTQITSDGNIVAFIEERSYTNTQTRMSSFKLNTSNTTVDQVTKTITFFGPKTQINTAIQNSTVEIAAGTTADITFTVTLTTKEGLTKTRTFTINN